MVMLALPVFRSVTDCVLLVPTTVLPKSRVVGVTLRSEVAPFPEREIVAGELVALLMTDTLPVTLPEAMGANLTEKVVFCPAGRITGGEIPLRLKPVPETLI